MATPEVDIPLTSPLRIHSKRGLPGTFSTPEPHGHISGHPRPPALQNAFNIRKNQILRSMTADQIEAAYRVKVKEILDLMEEDRRKSEEVEREVELLTKQREMERRVFWKLREDRERAKKGREGADEKV